MNVRLYITYEPENGKAITLARVGCPELLLDAARTAIEEASELADDMAAQDPILGQLQRREAHRLRRSLELVIPELKAE